MTDDERIEAAASRYRVAAHAMQAGVGLEHAHGANDGSPKMLRTGVNSALVDSAGLARLLVDKGVITMVEYTEAVAQAMEEEKARYEKRLRERYGLDVTLGGLDAYD